MAHSPVPLLRMRGITKGFPGVVALESVDLDVRRGEVHLLLGENGAGKSTLMKILSGAYEKDRGTIEINGQRVEITSPHQAQELGVSMIYQEMNLVPNLTVAENIFLGREPSRFGFVRTTAMEQEASRLLRRLHAGFAPSTPVRQLPVAQQQLVEISKALSLNAKIVVMDEPTASLTQREVQDLFRVIRSLKASSVAVIYITHRLEEARAIGDRVTVLRDGRVAGAAPVRKVSNNILVQLMVGRRLSQVFPAPPTPRPSTLLRVEDLGRKGIFGPVSFSLSAGEILGFAGLIGSGRTEMARCLVGADIATSGTVHLDGMTGRFRSPREAKRYGLCLLPEDRKAQGLVLNLSVLHNVSLASLARFSRYGWMRGREERKTVSALIDRLKVRTTGLGQATRNLSGGNQQKLVLAKWLAVKPRIIIFDEPTRGIDVGAKVEVYKLITSLAKRGVGIIMISSDLSEVLGLSHRVAVMHEGRLATILARKAATPQRVMRFAMGLSKHNKHEGG